MYNPPQGASLAPNSTESYMSAVSTDMVHGPVAAVERGRLRLAPLSFGAVVLGERGMLGNWQATNVNATIPHCIAQLEESGTLNNMRRVTGESTQEFRGFHFSDSDIYKTLEAIGWEAGRSDVSRFDAFVDATVDLLERAQQADGYLNSFYQTVKPEEKFSDLRWGHEMYCLGHLLQAGIAWERTTGRRDILEIGIRFADLVETRFGARGEEGICGHPEIETALVELFRTTAEDRYLDLAERMIDLRGRQSLGEDRFGYAYFQDHEPVREVESAVGHVVRQIYLTTGVTDVWTERGGDELRASLDRVWSSAHEQKMYVTGGLGAHHRDESFGDAFELPPDRAYSETCAAIANFQWNWRMLLVTGDSRYADEMERGLYNAIAASTDIAGTAFFYANPLQLRSGHVHDDEDAPSHRLSWYSCACCPPNLARLVASLHTYIATGTASSLQVHLYADGSVELPGGGRATLSTTYPFDSSVAIAFDDQYSGEVSLRMPKWSSSARILVDGVTVTAPLVDGYAIIPPSVDGIGLVQIQFGMAPVAHAPHPYIDASRGTIAVTRGPLVYCVEQADLPDGMLVEDVVVPRLPELALGETDVSLGAPTVVVKNASRRAAPGRDPYPAVGGVSQQGEPLQLITVPYFRWANRRQGGMRVWLPTE